MSGNSLRLTKEEWLNAADSIEEILWLVSDALLRADRNGQGKQDRENLLMDSAVISAAMCYVAENAADECYIVLKPSLKG